MPWAYHAWAGGLKAVILRGGGVGSARAREAVARAGATPTCYVGLLLPRLSDLHGAASLSNGRAAVPAPHARNRVHGVNPLLAICCSRLGRAGPRRRSRSNHHPSSDQRSGACHLRWRCDAGPPESPLHAMASLMGSSSPERRCGGRVECETPVVVCIREIWSHARRLQLVR